MCTVFFVELVPWKNCQSGNACLECVNGNSLKTYYVSLLKGEINNEQSYLIVKRKFLTYVIYFSSSAHLPLPIGRRGHVRETNSSSSSAQIRHQEFLG